MVYSKKVLTTLTGNEMKQRIKQKIGEAAIIGKLDYST
jgi:hypothetical protein